MTALRALQEAVERLVVRESSAKDGVEPRLRERAKMLVTLAKGAQQRMWQAELER